MMNRSTRLAVMMATSMILVAGAAPALAGDGCPAQAAAKSQLKASKAEKAKAAKAAQAAKRMVNQMKKELNQLTRSLDKQMRAAMAPNFEALRMLADSKTPPSDADLDALVAQFDADLEAASMAADQEYDKTAAAMREELVAMNPGAKLLAKADAMISRNQRKLDQKTDRLQRVFDSRLEEHFPDYAGPDEDEDSSDDSSKDPGDAPADSEPPSEAPANPDPAPSGGTAS